MTMQVRQQAVLFKLNAGAYGLDAAPAAVNAIRAFDLQVKPLSADKIERQSVQPWMGAGDTWLTNFRSEISFSVELAGSGAAGTAPAFAGLLKICGLAETLVEDESATYAPLSEGFPDGTLYFHRGKVLHKAVGCRGTFSLEIKGDGIPFLKFQLIGMAGQAGQADIPANIGYAAFVTPVLPSKINTPVVMIHGQSVKLASLTLDLGAKAEPSPWVNDFTIEIIDRAASAKARIEEPAPGTHNFWQASRNQVRDELLLLHGTAAGNVCEITAPKAQIIGIDLADQKGVACLDLDLSLKPQAGNDELTLTFK